MTTYPIVQATKPLNWQAIAQIAVHDNGEPLLALPLCSRIQLIPTYFNQHISGAINALVLRQTVAKKLQHAATLLPDTLGLVVFDGWRPLCVQQALRDEIRQQIVAKHPKADEVWIEARLDEFVANPNRHDMCPPHLTGGSVDVSLFHRATGEVLDMGSAFDEAGHLSYTAALENETDARLDAARQHRRILVGAMVQAGFTNIPTEWWHFDFGNQNWAYFSGAYRAIYGAAHWQD